MRDKKEQPKTKCHEMGVHHAWQALNSRFGIMSMSDPPQPVERRDRCVNCGLVRIYKEKTERWYEYELGA